VNFVNRISRPGRQPLTSASMILRLRSLLMLLVPLVLVSGGLSLLQPEAMKVSTTAHASTSGNSPNAPTLITPPSNLQIVPLDSSLHVTWNPSTDAATQWHVVSVWDGSTLQQAKVVGKTGKAAQTNGLMTSHAYQVQVQAMDAAGNLSEPVGATAATDPQSPMPNAAYFDNFNDTPTGLMDGHYYDVRTSDVADPDDDRVTVDQRQVFVSERHWHTMLLMGHGNGSVYVRPRVPFDISNGREGTLQFEMDFAAVQASHGKWAEFNFVKDLPKDAGEFGTDGGEDHDNSFNFSMLNGDIENNQFTFNEVRMTYNINGATQRIQGTGHFYTPANVRLPVVIKLSKTSAKMYVNGTLAAQASGFMLPWDSGYWIFPQINYSPAKGEHMSDDYGAPPILSAQLIHWETIQFDGPGGSINPVVRTFIQPGCSGTVHIGHNEIIDCPGVGGGYSYNFDVGGGLGLTAAQIRSAKLLFNGSGGITARINGNQFTASGGGDWDSLNVKDLNPAWFTNGQNSFSLVSGSAAQIEIEVIYNQPRVIGNPPLGSVSMIGSVIQSTPGQTNQSFRIEKLAGGPNILSRTVYLYSQGSAAPVAYTAQVITPNTPWLSVSPSTGVLNSPALGGGVVPMNMTVNFSGLTTSNEGEVGLIKITAPGVHMPLYIAMLAVNDGDSTDLNYIQSFSPMITTFNKSAIPGYGGGGPTPTPVLTWTPNSTPASTFTPVRTATSVRTSTPVRTATPVWSPTPGDTPTPVPTYCSMSFTDVPQDYWAFQFVNYLACNGIVSGYADGTFRPGNVTTRGQLSKIIVLGEGWAANTSGGPHFSDVPTNNPFYTYIETAYNRGVISGYADGTFRWGNNVTRGQLSKITVLAEDWSTDTSGGPHFTDVPTSDAFYAYIETAYNHGIISGYADGTFRPGNNATRAQISKIVFSALTGP
jgi:hypothetical protein